MGESTYGCRCRAKSVALQPRHFRISNICRTRTESDQTKKGETAGSICYGSFTIAQSQFSLVPQVLHTKAESAQQRAYKDFFHVWRGHSQCVCDAGTGSSGTTTNSRNLGVSQADRPNSAPVSSAFLISETAPQLSSHLPQVRTGDASGCLGGNIAAASTPRPVTSSDLSLRMLKYSTRLRPCHFRPSIVRCTTSEKLREAIRKLNAEIFQSDALQKFKEHIDLLQQQLKNSTNLLFEEQAQLSLIHNVHNSRPTSFIKKFGPEIMSMEKVCRENDKSLKDLQIGLILNFDCKDSLLSKVKNIHAENKRASSVVSRLASQVYDYEGRMDVESSWLFQIVKPTQEVSSDISVITTKIIDLQNYLSDLSDITDELASWIDPSHDYEQRLCALRTIFNIWQSTHLSIKNSDYLLELATVLCTLSKNLRSIHREKKDLAERFQLAELAVEQEGPKLEKTISALKLEVDMAERLYAEKLSSIPDDEQRSEISPHHIFKKITHDLDFSWRVREYNKRNIAPSIKTQGRGECCSVSTISAAQSLYKKQQAAKITLKGQVYQGKEFIINLSHNHLQDIVAQFFKMKQGKGKNKLQVGLEQMVEKGVLSESAYNNGNANAQDYYRYRINGFEEISKVGFNDACGIIEKGNVLIGNMYITKDYFRLGPDDVYDIPSGAIIETNTSGQNHSHCVVIVGFGVTPDGTSYYVFQNSYGPGWGRGGYGRVTARSLKHLYSPTLA